MKTIENVKGTKIENLTVNQSGTKVTMVFDLSKNSGTSKSGKSVIVSSSHGNLEIAEGTFINYNVYRTLPRGERVAAKKVTAKKATKTPEITPAMLEVLAKMLAGK